jgi:hypothetical protein
MIGCYSRAQYKAYARERFGVVILPSPNLEYLTEAEARATLDLRSVLRFRRGDGPFPRSELRMKIAALRAMRLVLRMGGR